MTRVWNFSTRWFSSKSTKEPSGKRKQKSCGFCPKKQERNKETLPLLLCRFFHTLTRERCSRRVGERKFEARLGTVHTSMHERTEMKGKTRAVTTARRRRDERKLFSRKRMYAAPSEGMNECRQSASQRDSSSHSRIESVLDLDCLRYSTRM